MIGNQLQRLFIYLVQNSHLKRVYSDAFLGGMCAFVLNYIMPNLLNFLPSIFTLRTHFPPLDIE